MEWGKMSNKSCKIGETPSLRSEKPSPMPGTLTRPRVGPMSRSRSVQFYFGAQTFAFEWYRNAKKTWRRDKIGAARPTIHGVPLPGMPIGKGAQGIKRQGQKERAHKTGQFHTIVMIKNMRQVVKTNKHDNDYC
jgi:hypothetical protein